MENSNITEQNIKSLPCNDKNNKVLFFPLPPHPSIAEAYEQKITLRNRILKKLQLYLEGVIKFGTVQEAMIYSGIKSRSTLKDYRDNFPDFAEAEQIAFSEQNAFMNDLAEKELFFAIRDKEPWAIKYYLDRKHPDYKPKAELGIGNVNWVEVAKQRDELKQLGNYVKAQFTEIPHDN